MIEVGKTYNGATVIEIVAGADRFSRRIVKYKFLPSETVHQCSEIYFKENFIKL
jgi:hypothetical protein